MKKPESFFEKITPATALRYLEQPAQNRTLSDRVVTAYAEAMKRGDWKATHQGIAFNKEGCLIDGQHRLWAIVVADIPVEMQVTLGLDSDVMTVIDRGRKRNLADELKILRGEPHATFLTAYTSTVARLLAGTAVVMSSVSDFDRWLALCEPGVRWAIEHLSRHAMTKQSAVAGSLAFAYKTNPASLQDFGSRLASGLDIRSGEPVGVLRHYLEARSIARSGSGDRQKHASGKPASQSWIVMVRKTLRAVQLQLEGSTLMRLEDSSRAIPFFLKSYDTKAIRLIVKPWQEAHAAMMSGQGIENAKNDSPLVTGEKLTMPSCITALQADTDRSNHA